MAHTVRRNTAEDKGAALQNELEMLQMELDANQLEQAELRGLERGLQERIEHIEYQLDTEDFDEDNEQQE